MLLFSYGSNSIKQLKNRLKTDEITSKPAVLHGWIRIFCSYSFKWDGGIASIHRNDDSNVYGSVVDLSDEQMNIIDKYEGNGYIRYNVDVYVDGVKMNAICYICKDYEYIMKPSNEYIKAIQQNMLENGHDTHISINYIENDNLLLN